MHNKVESVIIVPVRSGGGTLVIVIKYITMRRTYIAHKRKHNNQSTLNDTKIKTRQLRLMCNDVRPVDRHFI
jgi:hypothetical protein